MKENTTIYITGVIIAFLTGIIVFLFIYYMSEG